MKDLPSYKPLAKMVRRTASDKFRKLPYIEDGKLFFSYAFSAPHSFTDVQLKAWQNDEIDSPQAWYLFYIDIGDHPNRKRLPDYFDYGKVPEEIDRLYTSFWQIRLTLEHTSCKKAVEDAEYVWSWTKESDILGIAF